MPADVTQCCKEMVSLLKRIADRAVANKLSVNYREVQTEVAARKPVGISLELGAEASKWLARVTTSYSNWGGLGDDIDNLVMHACFFVLENSPSLHDFATELASCREEDARQEMIRVRFRQAMVVATPIILAMKADGVSAVRELAQSDLSRWSELSSALRLELERMLRLIAASKFGRAGFDPRYQRSATDPFGRPPRLDSDSPKKAAKARVASATGDGTAVDQELPAARSWRADQSGGDLMLQTPVSPREELPALVVDTPDRLEQYKNGLWRTFPGAAHRDPHHKPQQQAEKVELATEPNGLKNHKRLRPARMARTVPLDETNEHELKPVQKTRMVPWAPYVTDINVFPCDHPNCRMSFGRMYLLRMHRRSHDSAPNYYQYRNAPQLGLDPPAASTTMAPQPDDDVFPEGFGSDLPEHLRADLAAIREQLKSRSGVT